MPTRRTPVPADALPKLDAALSALRREAAGADPDPFDEALIAAVEGLAEAMRAEDEALGGMARRARMMGRQIGHGTEE